MNFLKIKKIEERKGFHMICLYSHFNAILENTLGFSIQLHLPPTSPGSQRVKHKNNFNITIILKRMANNQNTEVPAVMASDGPYINGSHSFKVM
jgi:hypothetical protein